MQPQRLVGFRSSRMWSSFCEKTSSVTLSLVTLAWRYSTLPCMICVLQAAIPKRLRGSIRQRMKQGLLRLDLYISHLLT